jgi:D-inositol-3-phosphate glycosyltransferase
LVTLTPKGRSARIVVVGPVAPLRGGIAQHTACLARALTTAGADAHVVGYRRLYPRALFPGTSELDEESLRPIDVAGAEACLVPWDARTWARALARIEAHDPDLVVVVWWHSLMLPHTAMLLTALRARGRRSLLLCHNVVSHERAVLDAAAWAVLSHLPSAFLVHGSHQRAALGRTLKRARATRPVHVVPHPAYDGFASLSHESDTTATAARARLGLQVDDEVVLMFGLVRRYKGLERALGVMERIAHARPRAVLVIAGEHYAARPPIPPRVRVHLHDRFIPNEEVADFFRAADLLLAPYEEGASHSGVVQIARAFGVPVVGTRTAGLSELVEDGVTGLLAQPDELAGALERLLADGGLRARMAEAMTTSCASFAWAALADSLTEIATAPR